MQFVPNQVMGYDRAITMFSPDGRLLQVEYAKKAVSLGAMALGVAFKDGVLLIADKHRPDKLIVSESVKKIFSVNASILITASGYLADARILLKKSRVRAQQHKLTYSEEIDVESIAKFVADIEQAYTQYGGIRPFGISLLLAGLDTKGPQLFAIEPTGTYFQYKAKAIGAGSSEANKYLETSYKSNIDLKSAIKLATTAFKKALGKEFSIERLEAKAVTNEGIKELKSSDLK